MLRRILFLPIGLVSLLQAQQPALLTGLVTDTTGAMIPGATLTLRPLAGGAPIITTSGDTGAFSLTAPPALYTLHVEASGFASYTNAALFLPRQLPLTVQLSIATQVQQVSVAADADATDPANNGDSLTLRASDIAALPTDQTQLNQQLTALTGGDAPQIYVNGFSNGTIPPKETIRSIKINQNPYSAINDTNPIDGRLEILTKPGADKFHGHLGGLADDSHLASKNPFAPNQPPYYFFLTEAGLSGPIDKRSSFYTYFNHRTYQGNTTVSATILDGNNQPILFNESPPAPNSDTDYEVRYDRSIGKASTLTARYQFDQNTLTDSGTGGLTLQSAGFNTNTTTQTLQLSNSQILSPRFVLDTRFQYIRSRIRQTPNSFAPSIAVSGAFNGGGSSGGAFNDNLDRYELQNYVSGAIGKHFLNVGARLRVYRDANASRANYNGQYTFASIDSYRITQQGLAAGLNGAAIRALGGGATQYTVTTGTPAAIVSQADLGAFVQDDWKPRTGLTISPGFRLESQSGIADHVDFAPRLGTAYNLFAKKDKPGKYTVRGGVGYFYARIGYSYLLQAQRQDGVSQQQFVFADPDTYPNAPASAGVIQPSSRYLLSPTLRAPTYLNTNLALERRFGTHGTVALAYNTTHGVHTLVTRNANAPLPGTYNPAIPTGGVRPFGTNQNIYEYDTEGVSRTRALQLNSNLNFSQRYLYGFYRLRAEKTDGQNASFAAHPYDLGQDYGRSGSVGQVLSIGGGGLIKYGISFNFYFNARAATPFNITVGQDLNGDSIFNDRPTYATDITRPSVVYTQYGALDTAPIAGQTTIPYNLGRAPALYQIYSGLSRSFAIGPVVKPAAPAPPPKPGAKPARPDRKYSLNLQLSAVNLLNHPNYASPVGVLTNPDPSLYITGAPSPHTSPGFGRPTTLANGNSSGVREIELNVYFTF